MAPLPRVRRGVLRIPAEVAWRLRAGHPWVYRDTLGDRPLREAPGDIVELVDPEGGFIARGYFDPEGAIAVRVLSRDPDEPIDAQAFQRRVLSAHRLREQHLLAPGGPEAALTAYRVLHGEGDFLPGLTVDRYGDYLVAHVYTAALEPHLGAIYDALESVHAPRAIYAQRRYRPLGGEAGAREPAELVRGRAAPLEVQVQEGSLWFAVDVTAPLGTGLFPDLRLGRQVVRGLAAGRRVLNLFSYTGALSLYAAAGGAQQVVSLDLQSRAHGRARRNLQLNGMPEAGHEFITGEAISVLARMADRRRQFDLVVMDPPAFSHARGQSFSVQKDYRELVAAALAVCAPGALLCCASNAARFTREDMEVALGEGASWAKRHVRIIGCTGLPVDFPVPAGFPEGHYLKFLTCAVI